MYFKTIINYLIHKRLIVPKYYNITDLKLLSFKNQKPVTQFQEQVNIDNFKIYKNAFGPFNESRPAQ